MSNDRALLVQQRQLALLARSSELRLQLNQQLAGFDPALAWANRVREGWHWLLRHPEVPAGAALLLVVVRPRRSLRWGMRWGLRLWSGWRLWRQVRGTLMSPR